MVCDRMPPRARAQRTEHKSTSFRSCRTEYSVSNRAVIETPDCAICLKLLHLQGAPFTGDNK